MMLFPPPEFGYCQDAEVSSGDAFVALDYEFRPIYDSRLFGGPGETIAMDRVVLQLRVEIVGIS
jgi:hypothetical protein